MALSVLGGNRHVMFNCDDKETKRSQDRGCRLPGPVGDGGSELDRFFEALAADRRRRILLYVQENRTASLEDICEALAEREEIDTDSAAFQRLQADLAHHQLPKLADYGLLSFDERTNTVSRESQPKAVEEILDLAADLEEPDDQDRSNELK